MAVEASARVKIGVHGNVEDGPALARNTGIEKASGNYMTFIDADDIWFPTFIENNIKTINETGIPFVFSSYRRSNEQLEFVYSDFIVPQKVSYTDILKSNSISCLTAFVDIKKLGKKYMPLIRKRQDMGLWLNYLKVIPFAYGIQETQDIYRQNKLTLGICELRNMVSVAYLMIKQSQDLKKNMGVFYNQDYVE